MNSASNSKSSSSVTPALPSPTDPKLLTLRARDCKLLGELGRRLGRLTVRDGFRNRELAGLVAGGGLNDAAAFRRFSKILAAKGLFELKGVRRKWSDMDGEVYTHTSLRAAETDMWPMGTHYWVRDNAIIGSRLLHSGLRKEMRLGKQILLSSLTFVSSQRQLSRFREIIKSNDDQFINDPQNWPYIFAGFKDNLSTAKEEKWAHQQEAWQMVAALVLKAEAAGLLSFNELTKKQLEFFGLLIPFFAKVNYWRCENSGSWEEIAAIRSSVRAWEHRLIVELGEKVRGRDRRFNFLKEAYTKLRRFLSPEFSKLNFVAATELLDQKGCEAMLKDLPYEAPSHPRKTPLYRQADAALIYLLELDYPNFLAERCGRDQRWARQMERKILGQVMSLFDRDIGGISRYKADSYQRSGFFRNETSAKLTEMYGGPSGDASGNFLGRDRIVPKGRRAAWTHFVWQLAAWSANRFLVTGDKSYRKLHDEMFTQGLKLVTGKEWSLDVGADGKSRIIAIPAWRMPECYIADRMEVGDGKASGKVGKELIFPSPHTPLNWAIGEMLAAFWGRARVLESELAR